MKDFKLIVCLQSNSLKISDTHLLRMRLATRVERTEEGKRCQKNIVVEQTKKKYNEKWQQRGQQGRLVRDVWWEGKKKKKNKRLEKDIETGRVFSEVPPYEDPCGERKKENNLSACTVCKGSFCF